MTWMSKVLHGTIDAIKEHTFLRVTETLMLKHVNWYDSS